MKLKKHHILLIAAVVMCGTFATSSGEFSHHALDQLSLQSMMLNANELNVAGDAKKAKSTDDEEGFTFRFPNIFKIFRSTF